MVIKMEKQRYEKLVKQHTPKKPYLKNAMIAFVVGGFVGLLGEILLRFFCQALEVSRSDASVYMIVTLIFFASLFTALGFFDKLVSKAKAGLIIPITGFAHSMTSSAIDSKKEGPIHGVGSNIFKLAGSVILYGVVAAWFFGLIRYLIEVFL